MNPTIRISVPLLIAAALAAAQPGGPVFRTEVRLVEVYATVLDNQGRYVDGLPEDRFRVLDNGAPQSIVAFENSAADLSCAILLDTTGSMTGALPRVKSAIARLIDQFREGDWVAVYGFSTGMERLQQFTRDKDAAKKAVYRTRAEGGTALFDAIARVSDEISRRNGKKVLVLFTDGDDNSSLLNAQRAVERARRLGIPLYTAAEGEALRNPKLTNELKDLSHLTGGKSYRIRDLKHVSSIFDDIAQELRHTYMLAYKPPPARSGDWRQIQISLGGAVKYKIQAKEGYTAY